MGTIVAALGWVLSVPTNVSNFVNTYLYLVQLNVSKFSTKILYSTCMGFAKYISAWVAN